MEIGVIKRVIRSSWRVRNTCAKIWDHEWS